MWLLERETTPPRKAAFLARTDLYVARHGRRYRRDRSMIQCGLKEEIYPLMEEAAKPLLDMAADQRSTAFDNEGHWGGCLWRPVIFLASCRHGEAEATVESALRHEPGAAVRSPFRIRWTQRHDRRALQAARAEDGAA